jgi:hypothetical protein
MLKLVVTSINQFLCNWYCFWDVGFSDCEQAAPPAGGGFFKPQVGGFQGGNFQGNKARS